jgi:hypothetical protein
MRLKNASTFNHYARTFNVTVKEKSKGLYVACLGDDPMADKKNIARNWGHKNYWGDKGWDNSRDKKDLWNNVLYAFKNDSRFVKQKDYAVNFQHCLTNDRCKELGLSSEDEEARCRKLDAEWIEWAKANGYSSPALSENNRLASKPVGRKEVVPKKSPTPGSEKTNTILPPLPDAGGFIERVKSVIGQPERNMEDVVKELLVRLGHPPNRIVFQRGRVDLTLQDGSGKPVFVFEVKRSIASESERNKALRQALDYANQTGAQFIVITDADRYRIYDRHRGYDFASQFCGSFQLTSFDAASEAVLDLLRNHN